MNAVHALLLALALLLPLVRLYLQRRAKPEPIQTKQVSEFDSEKTEPKSVMQPARDDLSPPKDDPITLEQLKQYDGSDSSKPIYVAIKGASASSAAPRCHRS